MHITTNFAPTDISGVCIVNHVIGPKYTFLLTGTHPWTLYTGLNPYIPFIFLSHQAQLHQDCITAIPARSAPVAITSISSDLHDTQVWHKVVLTFDVIYKTATWRYININIVT